MKIKAKQMSYGPVLVRYDGGEVLYYSNKTDAIETPYPPAISPAETLLGSLGACIVLSIKWVASQKKIILNPFTVEVVGTKALNLPSRFATMDIRIDAGLIDNQDQAAEIVAQAKTMCTISNSLNSDVILTIGR